MFLCSKQRAKAAQQRVHGCDESFRECCVVQAMQEWDGAARLVSSARARLDGVLLHAGDDSLRNILESWTLEGLTHLGPGNVTGQHG